jgi:hypothetical protein
MLFQAILIIITFIIFLSILTNPKKDFKNYKSVPTKNFLMFKITTIRNKKYLGMFNSWIELN